MKCMDVTTIVFATFHILDTYVLASAIPYTRISILMHSNAKYLYKITHKTLTKKKRKPKHLYIKNNSNHSPELLSLENSPSHILHFGLI